MASQYTAVTEITHGDYLKLVGLHTLAAHHRKALDDIVQAARTITGDTSDGGHTDDAIWSDGTGVDTLLKRIGITALPAENGAPATCENEGQAT